MDLPRSYKPCPLVGLSVLLLLTLACANRVETPSTDPVPSAETLDIGGSWESHYSDDIYDLPDYILNFKEEGRFEGQYYGGWTSGKLSGSYRWDGTTAILEGTDKTEIGDTKKFTMELHMEGNRLIEVTDRDFHLIFVRTGS